MSFYSTGPREVTAEYTVPERYQGYPGVVHGGITAAMLDETAGRSMTAEDDHRFFMTLKLEVKYRQQVPIETPLKIIGRLLQVRGRRAVTHGEILLPDGTVAAEAEALMIELPADAVTKADMEMLGWRVDEE